MHRVARHTHHAHAAAKHPHTSLAKIVRITRDTRIERLANGAEIVERTDPTATQTQLAIGTRAGALQDPQGKQGAAHLFEHLEFEGAGKRSGPDIRHEQRVLGGESNANTTLTHLVLTNTVAPADAKRAAEMMTDQYVHGDTHVSTGALAKQKAIVEQEMNYRLGTVSQIADDEESRLLYGDQPLSRDPIGTRKQVDAVTQGDVSSFHTKYFTGANTVALVDGKPDPATLALVKAQLAKLPKGRSVSEPAYKGFRKGALVEAMPDASGGPTVDLRVDLPAPNAGGPGGMLLTQIAADKLDERLREKDTMTYGVQANQVAAPSGSGKVLSITTKVASADARRAVAEIARTLQGLKHSVTAADVATARAELAQQGRLQTITPDSAASAAFQALEGSSSLGGAKLAGMIGIASGGDLTKLVVEGVTARQVMVAARTTIDFSQVKVLADGGSVSSADLTGGLADAHATTRARTVAYDKQRYAGIAGRT